MPSSYQQDHRKMPVKDSRFWGESPDGAEGFATGQDIIDGVKEDFRALTEPLYLDFGDGGLTLGDPSGLTLYGDRTVWGDMQASLIGSALFSVAGKVDYDFDDSALVFQPGGSLSVTNDSILLNFQMNHSAKPGTNLFLHVHWVQTSAVQRTFAFQYKVQENGKDSVSEWSAPISVTTGSANDVFEWISGSLNQITNLGEIPTSEDSMSSIVQVRLARTDSNAGDIIATFVDAHFEIDSLGSREQYAK